MTPPDQGLMLTPNELAHLENLRERSERELSKPGQLTNEGFHARNKYTSALIDHETKLLAAARRALQSPAPEQAGEVTREHREATRLALITLNSADYVGVAPKVNELLATREAAAYQRGCVDTRADARCLQSDAQRIREKLAYERGLSEGTRKMRELESALEWLSRWLGAEHTDTDRGVDLLFSPVGHIGADWTDGRGEWKTTTGTPVAVARELGWKPTTEAE